MDINSFNPDDFINSSISESNSTKTIPVPQGEYPAYIEKVTPRTWSSKDGTKAGIALDILWNIQDPAVQQQLGRDSVTSKQGLMLDTTPTGGLDTSVGKNIGLGRLRAALDLNTPGQPFSFAMLPGRQAKVTISHRIADENTFDEVKAVSKLA
jgi:hypothetical protein